MLYKGLNTTARQDFFVTSGICSGFDPYLRYTGTNLENIRPGKYQKLFYGMYESEKI